MARLMIVMLAGGLAGAGWADVLEVPGQYPTIQEAVDAASEGDEIHIAPGTYVERIDLAGKDLLLLGVGGADVTVIDGDGDGPVLTTQDDGSGMLRLEGLTIRGGRAYQGAGAFLTGTSVEIDGCVFSFNEAFSTDMYNLQDVWGGALYMQGGEHLSVRSSRFEDNRAVLDFYNGRFFEGFGRGGAIWCSGVGGGGVLIADSAFAGNESRENGGAVYVAAAGGVVRVERSTFEESFAVSVVGDDREQFVDKTGSGGSLHIEGVSLVVNDSRFVANESGSGGAIFAPAGAEILRCVFEGNRGVAQEGHNQRGGGGAVVMSSGTVAQTVFRDNHVAFAGGALQMLEGGEVLACSFIDNCADGEDPQERTNPGQGGALWIDGDDARIEQCLFDGNCAGDLGFAVYVKGTGVCQRVEVINCVFRENTFWSSGFDLNAEGTLSREGACLVRLVNCTITGSIAPAGEPSVFGEFFGNRRFDIDNCIVWGNDEPIFDATPRAAYSIVQGGIDGVGNLDTDPMFADEGSGVLRLRPGSPAIDAGDNTRVPIGVLEDFAGRPRFVDDPDTGDTGVGPAPVVDMGAYEYQASCLADLDGDGDADSVDFFAFLDAFGAGEPSADIDGDADLDTDDFFAFLVLLSVPCP